MLLRFGLPVNFQGMAMLPQKKQVKKLREVLNDIYFHLDSAGGLVHAVLKTLIQKRRKNISSCCIYNIHTWCIVNPSAPLPYIPARYVAGGEDLPSGLAGFGQVGSGRSSLTWINWIVTRLDRASFSTGST